MPRRISLPSLSLPAAIALSLALHGGLLLPDALRRLPARTPPTALQATLRLPLKPAPEPEPLLKNTLDSADTPKVITPPSAPPAPQKPAARPRPGIKHEVQAAQRKLSAYVFYPEAARVRGIEGTVRLLLILAGDGTIEDVQVIASSGHPVLDNAAAKGGWAIQKLPGSTMRELPLDYTFRLLP
jgi:protein TonB